MFSHPLILEMLLCVLFEEYQKFRNFILSCVPFTIQCLYIDDTLSKTNQNRKIMLKQPPPQIFANFQTLIVVQAQKIKN